jgi:hypothetical protein
VRLETVLDCVRELSVSEDWSAAVLVRNLEAGPEAYDELGIVDVLAHEQGAHLDLIAIPADQDSPDSMRLNALQLLARLQAAGNAADLELYVGHPVNRDAGVHIDVPVVGFLPDADATELAFIQWFDGFETEL